MSEYRIYVTDFGRKDLSFIRSLFHKSHTNVCHITFSDVVFPDGIVSVDSKITGQYIMNLRSLTLSGPEVEVGRSQDGTSRTVPYSLVL